jgi:tetratricopeptide (TPR) repeat protein
VIKEYIDQRRAALVDFKIFGRVGVRLDGSWPTDWQATKVRGMLGVLLTRPGKTIPVTLMIEWLWGQDGDPTRHPKTLHGYVTRLRRVLENLDEPARVEHVNAGYRLDIDRMRVDYHRAHALLADAQYAARHGDHERVCELLPEAQALSEEPPLVDLDTDLAESFQRTALTTLVLPTHYTLMTSQLALGYPERVLAALDDLQPQHELNVTFAKKRIDALRAADRDYEATDYCLHTRRVLQEHDRLEEADELLAHFHRHRPPIPAPRDPLEDTPGHREVPRRLPHDPCDFTGRDDLLAKLDAHTNHGQAAGIVVLTGTAGIGKTALAVHWARRIRDRFRDGYFYLDLHGFSRHPKLDSTDLARALLQAFNISADVLGDAEARWARLSGLLGDRHMLFVLDNAAEASQITPLLDIAPDAVVLVTSRQHLDHLAIRRGALEIHVRTLDRRTGARWLRETIGTRCEREPDAFTELVKLCSGIPLALRMVGHYADERPEVSLDEIARFLREEHRILSIGESTEDSDSSIRASFALSYRALPETARRIFRLLGLHTVPEIAQGAVAALAGSSPGVPDDLDVLVHSHLIQQTTGHYQLHDLLHEFAAERLQTDEEPEHRDQALTRLLDWYLHTSNNAERRLFPYRPGVPMLPAEGQVSPEEFTDDQDALRWFLRERQALLAAVHTAFIHGYCQHTWRLATAINEPLKRHGYYQDALACLEFGLRSTRALGDREGESISLNNLGYICISMRNFTAAYDYFSSAYQMCREIDHVHGAAVALHNMACQRVRINDLDAAESLFTEALKLQRSHRLDHARAGTLRRFGQLRRRQGDHSQAHVLYYEALAVHEKIGNLHGTGEVLSDLSQLHLDRGEHQAAIDFGHRALTCHQRSHDLVALAETCCVLAEAHVHKELHGQAIEYARESIRICWQTADHHTEARALSLLATTLSSTGHRTAAIEGWTRARNLYRSLGHEAWITIQHRLMELGAASPHAWDEAPAART